jgi:pimeloyl-ACP methyl ester carboxylesterase
MHTTKQRAHHLGDRANTGRSRHRDERVWSRCRRWRVLLAVCLITGAAGSGNLMYAATSAADVCDEAPTGVTTSDYFLDFTVPAGLMPDSQFDGRPAKPQVHRVQPVYSHGKCPEVAARAAVLIHGRGRSGPDTFDLRHPAPGGGTLSVQEGLARAGIDTFAPNLLGYGPSTTFDTGLDDPGNASLPPYEADGTTCLHLPEGCDRTHNPVFPLNQQGTLLNVNPLAGQRRAHTSSVRFAGTDVWVRDVRQVIDDAIARAHPAGDKVTLVGYSLGANRVGRARPNSPRSLRRSTGPCLRHRSSGDQPRRRRHRAALSRSR